jgi:hypothetical protein
LKKFVTIVACFLFVIVGLTAPAYAANDTAQSDQYTIPDSYLIYDIPDSGSEGTYAANFNETGAADPNGLYTFTVVIDTEPGEIHTKVISWSSNFPVYAVIVKGNGLYNMYQYDRNLLKDTGLKAPDNAEGIPSNVRGVTIVFNPETFPENPGTSPDTAPDAFNLIRNFLYRNFSILAIPLVVAFFLLGNLLGRLRSSNLPQENSTNETVQVDRDNIPDRIPENIPTNIPVSPTRNQDDETQLRIPPPYSRTTRSRYYNNTPR